MAKSTTATTKQEDGASKPSAKKPRKTTTSTARKTASASSTTKKKASTTAKKPAAATSSAKKSTTRATSSTAAKKPAKKTTATKTTKKADSTAQKAEEKKSTAKKAVAKKPAQKKSATKKPTTKKTATKAKSATSSADDKPTVAKKSTAKKPAGKKTATKKTASKMSSSGDATPKKTAESTVTEKKSTPSKSGSADKSVKATTKKPTRRAAPKKTSTRPATGKTEQKEEPQQKQTQQKQTQQKQAQQKQSQQKQSQQKQAQQKQSQQKQSQQKQTQQKQTQQKQTQQKQTQQKQSQQKQTQQKQSQQKQSQQKQSQQKQSQQKQSQQKQSQQKQSQQKQSQQKQSQQKPSQQKPSQQKPSQQKQSQQKQSQQKQSQQKVSQSYRGQQSSQKRKAPERPISVKRKFKLPQLHIKHNEQGAEAQAEALHREPLTYANPDLFETLEPWFRHVDNALAYDLAVEDGVTIVVAVSGGVDSRVLLDMLVELSFHRQYKIIVAHFNHRLRGKHSDKDAEFVESLANQYGLESFIGATDIKAYAAECRLSIEQAAREARYRFLEKISRNCNARYVAIAHTIDDSVETFLLNLVRGSGLTGLSGIPARRLLSRDTSLIRPLLDLRKDDLVDYAQKANIEWREDSSNGLYLYTRNKVRGDLLPHLREMYSPNIDTILLRTARLMKGADQTISQITEQVTQNIVTEKSYARVSLSVAGLISQTWFLQGEILQRVIQRNFHVPPISLNAIDRILELTRKSPGTRCDISKRLFALREGSDLTIAEKLPAFEMNKRVERSGKYSFGDGFLRLSEVQKANVKFARSSNLEYVDADLLPNRLTLRNWQPGDTFKPLGMNGTMTIGDFLTNNKVSQIDRQFVLVLATETEIVWVCGMRIDNRFRVTSGTKRAIKMEFKSAFANE